MWIDQINCKFERYVKKQIRTCRNENKSLYAILKFDARFGKKNLRVQLDLFAIDRRFKIF